MWEGEGGGGVVRTSSWIKAQADVDRGASKEDRRVMKAPLRSSSDPNSTPSMSTASALSFACKARAPGRGGSSSSRKDKDTGVDNMDNKRPGTQQQ